MSLVIDALMAALPRLGIPALTAAVDVQALSTTVRTPCRNGITRVTAAASPTGTPPGVGVLVPAASPSTPPISFFMNDTASSVTLTLEDGGWAGPVVAGQTYVHLPFLGAHIGRCGGLEPDRIVNGMFQGGAMLYVNGAWVPNNPGEAQAPEQPVAPAARAPRIATVSTAIQALLLQLPHLGLASGASAKDGVMAMSTTVPTMCRSAVNRFTASVADGLVGIPPVASGAASPMMFVINDTPNDILLSSPDLGGITAGGNRVQSGQSTILMPIVGAQVARNGGLAPPEIVNGMVRIDIYAYSGGQWIEQ